MNGLLSTTNKPAFNLATEEYLLRHTTKDVFFLYTNTPSIIVGKHQNTLGEINYRFVNEKHIPVYRRLSGGGTVYHDGNNLNFCFIQTGKKGELVNFERYSEPIILALKELGVNAAFGKRHDILIEGKKVSGNASHVYKSRVMHHGTLLYNTDLSILNKALKTNPLLIKDKAVKSVRSEVTNIADHLNEKLPFEKFVQYIFDCLIKHYKHCGSIQLTSEESDRIKALSEEKYNTREWNYGYSPNYELNKRIKLSDGARIQSRLKIEKGRIAACTFKSSDQSLSSYLKKVSEAVIGEELYKNTIKDIIYKIQAEQNHDEAKDEILGLFFT